MLIERTYRVQAPLESVWDALMNLETLATCIPGCDKCEKLDDKTYSATVKTRVSYITAEFKGKLVVEKVEPLSLIEVSIKGQDSKLASLMNAKTRAEVRSLGPNETEITCVSDASVGGRLGALGGGVIRSKAEEMLDQTFETARVRLLT